MEAAFIVRVNLYRDEKKIDSFATEKVWQTSEEEIFTKKDCDIELPVPLPGKGDYMLDVIVEDAKAVTFAKFRNLIKKKVR